jgi:hypothetical protein
VSPSYDDGASWTTDPTFYLNPKATVPTINLNPKATVPTINLNTKAIALVNNLNPASLNHFGAVPQPTR